MTYQIINLAIDALSQLANASGNNSAKFNYAVAEAKKSLKNVLKYL